MKIQIKIEYKKEFEYEKIADICNTITEGFFQTHRFLLSPKLIKNIPTLIYLPKYDYSNIKDFWKRISILSPVMTMRKGNPIFKEMEYLEIKEVTEKEIKELKRKISKEILAFEKNLNYVFKNIKEENVYITLRPTRYGAGCTFPKPIKKGNNIYIDYIWYRIDTPLTSIFEGITSSIVMNLINSDWHNDMWNMNEYVVDFLLQNTSLSLSTKNFKGTVESLNNANSTLKDLVSISKSYYEELGYPIISTLKMKNEKILHKGKLIKGLKNSEEKILSHMITNKERVVTFEEIGNILWKEDSEKYSQWAITKLIQRIRERLKANNIPPTILQTVKRVGYVLYD